MKLTYFYCLAFPLLGILGCAKQHNVSQKETKVEVIGDFFPNEVRPVASKPCFAGAYYRKLVSSVDNWVGISGTVVLPQITFDESRKNPKNTKQYLDNPSVYLGGLMDGQETDIGLSWEVIKDKDGKVSESRVAFRPFLRRTGHKSGQQAVFVNGPATADYYWYPGEEVFMQLETIGDGLVKFVIKGAGKRFETTFECAGYSLKNKGEFKRVNAIDQMGNEGKPVQATKTVVSKGKWLHTDLLRVQDGQVVKAPFHEGRYTPMSCPQPQFFAIEAAAKEKHKGAETININGAGY
ncbi:hypothetical protein [Sphingobacterium psychroaquaticum]|uniref:Uncharacterized protein n=1 Tax=Sphingobacterium psychroaquaticum TaxID=561061 RepID=A0A1X7KHM8_9SPHI|nr:hypothetical protein [Sphingobacterium psychroaquaticum]SMG40713.1 hypothetical protein SAMN05660862_2921 [Sphingobacterium psychroaquaticum]